MSFVFHVIYVYLFGETENLPTKLAQSGNSGSYFGAAWLESQLYTTIVTKGLVIFLNPSRKIPG
jgi:hypothetical protein